MRFSPAVLAFLLVTIGTAHPARAQFSEPPASPDTLASPDTTTAPSDTLAAAASSPASVSGEKRLGYVAPDIVEGWFDTAPTVEVNLDGALLDMVANASQSDQPEAAALLRRLTALRVRIFPTEGVQMSTLESRAGRLMNRLSERGWQTVVRVRDENEQTNIQVRMREDSDAVAGLVVLVNQPGGESVFANLVGNVSPSEVGDLSGAIEGLDVIGSSLGGSSGRGDDGGSSGDGRR
ncbi:MAG: hypothetical protein BRD46_00785 [Bacteroidetes bacterium QS_8_68_15]|nr:MAG: hypothetical protein BRD46_00785 [Bacteroidetes bacterium QS_8_68_15]